MTRVGCLPHSIRRHPLIRVPLAGLAIVASLAALAPARAQSGPAQGRGPSRTALAGLPALFRHVPDSVQWARYTTLEDCGAAADRLLRALDSVSTSDDTAPSVVVAPDTTDVRYRRMRALMRGCIGRLAPADSYTRRFTPLGSTLWRRLALASGDDALLAAVIDTQLGRVRDIVPTPPNPQDRLDDDTAAGGTLADRQVTTEAEFLRDIVGELLRERPAHVNLARRLITRFTAAHPDRPMIEAALRGNFLVYAQQQHALDAYTAEVDTQLALTRRAAVAPPGVIRRWGPNEKAGQPLLRVSILWRKYQLALIRGGREAARPWADSLHQQGTSTFGMKAPPITADYWQPAAPPGPLPARDTVSLVLYDDKLGVWNASVVGRLMKRFPRLSVVVIARLGGQFRGVAVPDRAHEAELRFQELAKQWGGRFTFAAGIPPADTLPAPDGRIVRGKTATQRAYASVGLAVLVGPDGRIIDQATANRENEWFLTLLLDGIFARSVAPAATAIGTNSGNPSPPSQTRGTAPSPGKP